MEQAAESWERHKQQIAAETEQQRVLNQMLFFQTPLQLTNRAPSVELPRCTDILSSTDLDSFEFNVFDETKHLGKRPLSSLAMHIICDVGIPETVPLDKRKLHQYLRHIEDGYRSLPYHNILHVADVLQRLHAILRPAKLPAEKLLAAYIAAVVHDYGHGGVTNSFLIATENIVARKYNNRSPWENFHVFHAFEILRLEEYAFLPRTDLAELKRVVIELVLATDLAVHVQVLRQPGQNAPDSDHQAWLLRLAIKCADVGHAAAPTPLHKRWTRALEEELRLQAQLEEKAGLSVTLTQMQKSQVDFFEVIILPMFRLLANALPHTDKLLRSAEVNRRLYTDQ